MHDGHDDVAFGAIDDLDIDPADLSGEELAQYLETRLQETLAEILASPAWRLAGDPKSPPERVQAMLREIDLDRLAIQPAVLASLRQTTTDLPDDSPAMLRDILADRMAEIEALPGATNRAYARRGGSLALASGRTISPGAFSAIATWRALAGDPYLTLGALYLVEGLLPLIHAMIDLKVSSRGAASRRLTLLAHNLGAFLDHTSEVRATIVAVADARPKSRTAIAYGFEYLRQTTPLPIWEAARQRALRQNPGGQMAAE